MKRYLIIGMLLLWANLFGLSVANAESVEQDVKELAALNWPVREVPVARLQGAPA